MNPLMQLGFLILLFAAALPIVAGAGAGKGADAFYGYFDGKDFDGTRETTWWFNRTKEGEITLSMSIYDSVPKVVKGKKIVSKRVVALGSGKDFKVVGKSLEFTIQWSQSHMIKGPEGAKYVAEIKGNDFLVKWEAGDKKGEISAANRNPVVAKKDDKKDDKKQPGAPPEKVYLSGLITDKGIPAQKGNIVRQLGLVIVMAKGTKPQYVNVTKDTKFVVVDGEDKKTFDQKTVVDDPQIHVAFHERYVTLERQANTALTVTATAVTKKGAK